MALNRPRPEDIGTAPTAVPANYTWQVAATVTGTVSALDGRKPQQKYVTTSVTAIHLWSTKHPTINFGDFGYFRLSFRQGGAQVNPDAVEAKMYQCDSANSTGYATTSSLYSYEPSKARNIRYIYLKSPSVYRMGTKSAVSDTTVPLFKVTARFPLTINVGTVVDQASTVSVVVEHFENAALLEPWGPFAQVTPPKPDMNRGGWTEHPDNPANFINQPPPPGPNNPTVDYDG